MKKTSFLRHVVCAGLLLAVGLALAGGAAHAQGGATYYVAPGGDNAGPGSLSQPWASIDYAASRLQPGDTVFIRGGEYHEWVETYRSGTLGAPITFRAYPGEQPILDGEGVSWNYGFNIAGGHSYLRVEGLTIRHFAGYGLTLWGNNRQIDLIDLEIFDVDTAVRLTEYAIPGGVVEDLRIEGVYLHDNALLGVDCAPGPCRRVEIVDSVSTYNGAGNNTAADGFAFESGSDIRLVHCQAVGNAGDGFDFKSDSTRIERSLSQQNARDGIKLWGVDSVLENSIARDNFLAGVVLAQEGTYTVTNTIVAHNAVDIGGYGMYVAYDAPATASLSLYNNIFAFNGSAVYFGAHVTLNEDHNIYYSREDSEIQAEFTERNNYSRDDINFGFWFMDTGNGRFSGSIDPAFMDATCRDYHSQPDSPAVDAGSNAWAPALDYDGISRPRGSAADIGAYEWLAWQRVGWLPLLRR